MILRPASIFRGDCNAWCHSFSFLNIFAKELVHQDDSNTNINMYRVQHLKLVFLIKLQYLWIVQSLNTNMSKYRAVPISTVQSGCWTLFKCLILIRMARGIYDSWNIEQIQLKKAQSKNTFYRRSFLTKCFRIIPVQVFHQKNAVLGNFSMKK
jgi:hypothetical protein